MLYKQQLAIKDKNSNSGFTLIEVLIALAIFAIGILALTSLQAVYIGGNSSARMQTEATTLAAQWLERFDTGVACRCQYSTGLCTHRFIPPGDYCTSPVVLALVTGLTARGIYFWLCFWPGLFWSGGFLGCGEHVSLRQYGFSALGYHHSPVYFVSGRISGRAGLARAALFPSFIQCCLCFAFIACLVGADGMGAGLDAPADATGAADGYLEALSHHAAQVLGHAGEPLGALVLDRVGHRLPEEEQVHVVAVVQGSLAEVDCDVGLHAHHAPGEQQYGQTLCHRCHLTPL